MPHMPQCRAAEASASARLRQGQAVERGPGDSGCRDLEGGGQSWHASEMPRKLVGTKAHPGYVSILSRHLTQLHVALRADPPSVSTTCVPHTISQF